MKKKTGRGGFEIKPFQVKSHLWIFANTLIENPTFDSQTKENMTLRKSSFGSTCDLNDKYIKDVSLTLFMFKKIPIKDYKVSSFYIDRDWMVKKGN